MFKLFKNRKRKKEQLEANCDKINRVLNQTKDISTLFQALLIIDEVYPTDERFKMYRATYYQGVKKSLYNCFFFSKEDLQDALLLLDLWYYTGNLLASWELVTGEVYDK